MNSCLINTHLQATWQSADSGTTFGKWPETSGLLKHSALVLTFSPHCPFLVSAQWMLEASKGTVGNEPEHG